MSHLRVRSETTLGCAAAADRAVVVSPKRRGAYHAAPPGARLEGAVPGSPARAEAGTRKSRIAFKCNDARFSGALEGYSR